MPRPRRENPFGLPDRVYPKGRSFYWVHRNVWHPLGSDLEAAKLEGKRLNDRLKLDIDGDLGRIRGYWPMWLESLRKRIGLPKSARGIKQRTYDDYADAETELLRAFGHMTPDSVIPKDISDYLADHAGAALGDDGKPLDRPIRANKEIAALSVFFSWCVQEGYALRNPCLDVRRNPEKKRARYVTDEEYLAVYEASPKSVRMMMELAFRTLQRPEDILRWSHQNIITVNRKKVLHFEQGKTGTPVDIEISGRLAELLAAFLDEKTPRKGPLVSNLDGERYTLDGLSSLLKKRYARAKVKAFGFQDLKAKGATDMYRGRVPLDRIQMLCGHESPTTTLIYVKQRMHDIVTANDIEIGAPAAANEAA